MKTFFFVPIQKRGKKIKTRPFEHQAGERLAKGKVKRVSRMGNPNRKVQDLQRHLFTNVNLRDLVRTHNLTTQITKKWQGFVNALRHFIFLSFVFTIFFFVVCELLLMLLLLGSSHNAPALLLITSTPDKRLAESTVTCQDGKKKGEKWIEFPFSLNVYWPVEPVGRSAARPRKIKREAPLESRSGRLEIVFVGER